MPAATEVVTHATVIAMPTADAHFAGVAPEGHKSLIPISGRPAISRLVESLASSEQVSQAVVVGEQAVLDAVPEAGVRIVSDGREAERVVAGVRAADDAERCLVMAGDMPLAVSEAVDDLLANAPAADVVYPITSRADFEELFPHRKTGYVKAREGQFTGSSCLLVRKEAALVKERLLVDLLEARRNPALLLGLVGAGFGLKLMFSAPSLVEFEHHLSDALGLSCRVFVTHYPELLFSLDSPHDAALAEGEIQNEK